MATTIGLPTLKIAFQKAAEQVANRSKKGYAALFVRDSREQGVHMLNNDTLIPFGLGEENKSRIKACFQGSSRGIPSLIVLVVIAPGTEDTTALEAGLKLLERHNIDYLAGPSDATETEMAKLVEWVKGQRAQYRPVKLVKPWTNTGSDHMGIIELDESGLERVDGSVTAGEYCGRLAGILAGIPSGMSCTNVSLPELTAVTARTTQERIEAIKNGKLIFVHDGLQAKIARGVNSLTTIPPDGNEDWAKIKIVEGMDLITYFLRTTIENSYMGQYPNTYDNKQLLVTAITDFFLYLEQSGLLAAGTSFVRVDYSRQLQWLRTQGVDTSSMTEQQIMEYQTGTWVFLACGGRLVDAMEDFEIRFGAM